MDFFNFGNMVWIVLAPPTWLILATACGVLCLWRNRLRGAKIWLTSVLATIVTVTFVPVADPLLRHLESRFPQPNLTQVEAIVILGGASPPDETRTWGQYALNGAGERVLFGLALAAKFPDALVVYTGRNESLMALNSAMPLDQDIMQLGKLTQDRFIREGKSRSTYENAILTAPLLPTPANTRPLLITSAWHMPRSVAAFCAAGVAVTPFPVDYRSGRPAEFDPKFGENMDDLAKAVHEYIGLAAYYVSGRTAELFPKGC